MRTILKQPTVEVQRYSCFDNNEIAAESVVRYCVQFQWRWWNRLWRPLSEFTDCRWLPMEFHNFSEAYKAAYQLKGHVYAYRFVAKVRVIL